MRLTPTVLVVGAAALAGCGGAKKQAAAPTGTANPQIAVVTATATAPAATATPVATSTPVATATTAPTTAPTATATATATVAPRHTATPVPTATPKPDHSEPTTCLREAKLAKAKHTGSGLWAGTDPSSGELVNVDGPYIDLKALKASMQTLDGISIAKRGGRYVVSAGLRTHLDTAVTRVASCLERLG